MALSEPWVSCHHHEHCSPRLTCQSPRLGVSSLTTCCLLAFRPQTSPGHSLLGIWEQRLHKVPPHCGSATSSLGWGHAGDVLQQRGGTHTH